MYRSLSGSHRDGGNAGGSAAAVAMPGYFMASFYPVEMGGGGGGGGGDAPTDRALIASRNHREAEKRRRERIKSHLDRLRTILACDPKTDKASLLAKAVERVRDLKQRTADITETQLFPTENDEIVVLPSSSSNGERSVFEASLCCEDRSDLLPELIETLRSLRLKTLRAEIATLGGRVRNVLVLAKEKEEYEEEAEEGEGSGGAFLRDALKALVDRPVSDDRSKRRRVVDRGLA
ncbi:transcription factor bHLH106-like [Phoenix dactylifera]|uniref:Transcription factor bHLH106-like n=1 Tax=Phoenix dactylifera TaxID=42345 RepID=A0A8B7BZG3_PHODC|nr:transcription factor bHLH106-like [Phoenix dactylifera]